MKSHGDDAAARQWAGAPEGIDEQPPRGHPRHIAPVHRHFYKNKNLLGGRSARQAVSLALCSVLLAVAPAAAQKKGGTLRLYHNDNPPSASLLEESTIASVTPFSAVFNNLVVFDPFKVHESLETVVPDLAESWSWDASNTRLTFKLRQGVKWHDGQPFTAKDVQCTWRMLVG